MRQPPAGGCCEAPERVDSTAAGRMATPGAAPGRPPAGRWGVGVVSRRPLPACCLCLWLCACAVAARLCAAATIAAAAASDGHLDEVDGPNLTAVSRPLLPAAALDDDLHDLHDLFWPLNDSWLIDTFDEFDHDHFENAGDLLPEARPTTIATPRTPADPPEPEFDSSLVTNVTAQLGATAFLHCRVRNLGQHTVSWVRRRDWHILASGLATYTSDQRFQVAHSGARDWSLQIQYVQRRDSGAYECQVATGAGTMSHLFNLHVVAPAAFILGSGEYHIGEGSTISLVCIIENSPAAPLHVSWWHNDRLVSSDGSRALSVSTEAGARTHSRLLIPRASRGDSGNYTCGAPDTQPDTISVFVSQGDNTAAIQRQSGAAPAAPAPLPPLVSAALFALAAATAGSARTRS